MKGISLPVSRLKAIVIEIVFIMEGSSWEDKHMDQ